MADTCVREVVAEVIGKDGDDAIREYITSILEFDDFDYGRGGENAYDSFGEMLVRLVAGMHTLAPAMP